MTALETILKTIQDVRVIDDSIGYNQYIPLDLSVSNVDISKLDADNSTYFEEHIKNYLNENNAQVAYGGYNEVRNLYKRSIDFNDKTTDERNVHIGLDLWIKAGTTVLAALDGTVHSFGFNAGLGNYGPTIILKHQIENQTFYTLYGHLSLESIQDIKIGMIFKKGQTLATLGDASVNGDYPSHLHFQIIEDIGVFFGDYPGVCSQIDLNYYLANCPNPNLLLKIT
jgi:murein DD-endopeptidase MepM/ murein hydrolase activator NlpD